MLITRLMQFAKYQKESIDTGLSDDFMAENLKQPNANKVHALTAALEIELTVRNDPCQDIIKRRFG